MRPHGTEPASCFRFEARMAARDELWQKIRAFTEQHSVDEIVGLAAAMRIPVSPVGDGRAVLSVDDGSRATIHQR